MSLGETILILRTQRNMSQEELANSLGVSRQSVSKWETDASTPELDKLIKIAELFDVTLDRLVYDKELQAAPSDKPCENRSSGNTRIIAGTILLCFGFTAFLLLSVLGGFLSGLIFSTPFILCALVCFFVRRFTALWCLWALYISVDLYLHWATGLMWTNVFFGFFYLFSSPLAIFFAWVLFLLFASLCVATALCYRKDKIKPGKGNILKTVALWLLFVFLPLTLRIFGDANTSYMQTVLWRIFSACIHYLRTVILVYACVQSARLCHGFVKARKRK